MISSYPHLPLFSRSCALLLAVVCLLPVGCGGLSDGSAPEFESTLDGLQSDNWGERYDALENLEYWRSEAITSADQGIQLIELVTGDKGELLDLEDKNLIFEVLAEKPHPMYVDPLIGVFDDLPSSCRDNAVQIYVSLDMPTASDALVNAVETYENSSYVVKFDGWELGSSPGHAEKALPKLAKFLEVRETGKNIFDAILTAYEYGYLDGTALQGNEDKFYSQSKAFLRDSAFDAEKEASIYSLFELWSEIGGKHAEQFFAMSMEDYSFSPRIRMLAVGQLMTGEDFEIPSRVLNQLAEDEKTRYRLFALCEANDRMELFPKDYRQLRSLADSMLVDTVYEWEAGLSESVKYTFITTVTHKNDDGTQNDYLVYRYGISDSAYQYSAYVDQNWVGVIGPIDYQKELTIACFGTCDLPDVEFAEKTPKQHVEYALELRAEYDEDY